MPGNRLNYARLLPKSETLREGALRLARRGFRVFPAHSFRRYRCTCMKRACRFAGKHPRIARWKERATTNPVTIKIWWHRRRDNIAIATGRGSRLAVLDVDPRNSGDKSLLALRTIHGELPVTLTVSTGGGGLHYYFRHPDREVRWTDRHLGPGLELKGDGKLVIAPCSLHASGGRYRFLTPIDTPLAELPEWLVPPTIDPEDLQLAGFSSMRRGTSRRAPAPLAQGAPLEGPTENTTYGLAALQGECDKLRRARESNRNNTLYEVSLRLGSLIAGGHLSEEVVFQNLTRIGHDIGLHHGEILRTLQSGLTTGKSTPRSI